MDDNTLAAIVVVIMFLLCVIPDTFKLMTVLATRPKTAETPKRKQKPIEKINYKK